MNVRMSSDKNTATVSSFTVRSLSAENVGIILSFLAAIGLYIGSFVSVSQFVGSKDDWNQLKPEISKIWGLSLAGSFCLYIASLLYFIQDPEKAIYFILAVSCLTIGLSYSALAVAAISR